MLLPTKNMASDRALVTLGGQILLQLDRPGSVSAVWERLRVWRTEQAMPSTVPFWWFALALDVLYAIGAVSLHDGELRRIRRAD